ncbi:hypothetical protein DMC47_27060 [Nostoc sp. 3335mG]|nr:hypothetical protein DMC47_27060 [Nostoc sp. 3335mG]
MHGKIGGEGGRRADQLQDSCQFAKLAAPYFMYILIDFCSRGLACLALDYYLVECGVASN